MTSIAPVDATPTPETPAASATPGLSADGLHPTEIKWSSAPTDETPTPPASPDSEPTPPGESPDGEPTPPAEPVSTVHAVEFVLPNGDGENGTTNAGKFVLEVNSQEAADGLRYHLKQSARAQGLEKKLDQHQTDVATMRFMRERPVDGMLLIAEQVPQAGVQFAQTWMAANPMEAAKELQKLGFQVGYQPDVDPTVAERLIAAEARAAALTQQNRVRDGRQAFEQTSQTQRFGDTAIDVVRELAGTLGLAEGQDEHLLFATAASEKLARLANTSPNATSAEMTLALKDLAATYAAVQVRKASASARVADQPRDPAGQFQKLAAKNEKFAKVGGGQTVVSALSATKLPPGTTMEQATENLRKRGSW